MLASNRKHKVIGRTMILTISTRLKNEIKYHGELEGTSNEMLLFFVSRSSILINHSVNAKLKLKASVVVTG